MYLPYKTYSLNLLKHSKKDCKSVFFCCQIDDIFSSTSVNGKETGSAATSSQPNRVCFATSHYYTQFLIKYVVQFIYTLSAFARLLDVSDFRGETAIGQGAGAGGQTEEPTAVGATDDQTSHHRQCTGKA